MWPVKHSTQFHTFPFPHEDCNSSFYVKGSDFIFSLFRIKEVKLSSHRGRDIMPAAERERQTPNPQPSSQVLTDARKWIAKLPGYGPVSTQNRLYLGVTWPSLNGSINRLQCSCFCVWTGLSAISFSKIFHPDVLVCYCTYFYPQIRVSSGKSDYPPPKKKKRIKCRVRMTTGCGRCSTKARHQCGSALLSTQFIKAAVHIKAQSFCGQERLLDVCIAAPS